MVLMSDTRFQLREILGDQNQFDFLETKFGEPVITGDKIEVKFRDLCVMPSHANNKTGRLIQIEEGTMHFFGVLSSDRSFSTFTRIEDSAGGVSYKENPIQTIHDTLGGSAELEQAGASKITVDMQGRRDCDDGYYSSWAIVCDRWSVEIQKHRLL